MDFGIWEVSVRYECCTLHMEQHQADASMASRCKKDSRFTKLIFPWTDLLSNDYQPHCFCCRNRSCLKTDIDVRQPKQDVQHLHE